VWVTGALFLILRGIVQRVKVEGMIKLRRLTLCHWRKPHVSCAKNQTSVQISTVMKTCCTDIVMCAKPAKIVERLKCGPHFGTLKIPRVFKMAANQILLVILVIAVIFFVCWRPRSKEGFSKRIQIYNQMSQNIMLKVLRLRDDKLVEILTLSLWAGKKMSTPEDAIRAGDFLALTDPKTCQITNSARAIDAPVTVVIQPTGALEIDYV